MAEAPSHGAADGAGKSAAIGGNLTITSGRLQGGAAEQSNASLMAAPTVDLFFGGWSLGASAEVGVHRARMSQPDAESSRFARTSVLPAARVGYLVPLGERAAFWPILSAGYGFAVERYGEDGAAQESKLRMFDLTLTPQVLLFPTKHFFLRFNPGSLSYRVTKRDSFTHASAALGVIPALSFGVGLMW